MPLFGPPNVEKMERKGNWFGLLRALRYRGKDWDGVPSRAAEALGRIKNARAVEPLIVALRDPDCIAHKNAAEALGWIGDARAVEPLIAALRADARRGTGIVSEEFTEALGRIGAPAVEPLSAELRDTRDPNISRAAAEALGKIGAPAVEPLIAALRDSLWISTEAVVEALGKIGAPAVEPLIAAPRDDDGYKREHAAKALDKIGWRPDEGERGAAYWVAKSQWDRCVAIGAPAVAPLIDALRPRKLIAGGGRYPQSDWTTRKSAAEALVALYRSGRLDEEHRRLVLAQGPEITRGHEDSAYWKYSSSDCYDAHDDTGIGVSFPK